MTNINPNKETNKYSKKFTQIWEQVQKGKAKPDYFGFIFYTINSSSNSEFVILFSRKVKAIGDTPLRHSHTLEVIIQILK